MKETQVQKLMRILDCTEEEAKQVLADDKAIDQGQRMPFDLSTEEEKKAKKYANSGTRKTTGNTTKVRKENPTKAGIIAKIEQFLKENTDFAFENIEITNKERQIAFKIGENSYELTLIQKRKPK